MTIAATVTAQQYSCNGSTTQFSFPNKVFAATDLVVTLIDLLGNLYPFVGFANVGLGLNYTVQNVDVDTGCLVAFNLGPANGWTLDIRTVTPNIQSTSIKNQGAFLPELHEEAFDKITREAQDLRRLTYTFGIHGPDIESVPWPPVPAVAVRKGQYLAFDSNGLPTVLGPAVSTPLATQQVEFFGTDSGTANAYVVATVGTIPLTLTSGVVLRFTAANASTGTATLNAGGTGIQPIVSEYGIALSGGEIQTSAPTWAQWNGSAWQIVTGISPACVRTAAEIAGLMVPTNLDIPPLPVDPRRFGAKPDWNGTTGTDNAAIIQACFTFAQANNFKGILTGGSYRIASGLSNNGTAGLFWEFAGSALVADFSGSPAITLTGGAPAAPQLYNFNVQPSPAQAIIPGTFSNIDTVSHGIFQHNCGNAKLTGYIANFRGDGFLLQNDGTGNSNQCQWNLNIQQCSYGFVCAGTTDNMAVEILTLNTFGCANPGFYAPAGVHVRDWWAWINNGSCCLLNTGVAGIFCALATNSTFLMYSEQNNAANEIDFSAAGNVGNFLTSMRYNKDLYNAGGQNIIWGTGIQRGSFVQPWTPVIRGSTVAGTFAGAAHGFYVQNGNMITAWGAVTAGAIGGGPTGNLQIAGLPFAPNGATYAGMGFPVTLSEVDSLTLTGGKLGWTASVNAGNNFIQFLETVSAGAAAFTPIGNVVAATTFVFSVTYPI